MKPAIVTQKNVCAFLGLIMALTILWSAKAEAKVEPINEVVSTESNEGGEEMTPVVDIDLSDIKSRPTITFINKYGEVVAEFYGSKSELEARFSSTFEKGKFLTASGNQEFYLQ